MKKLAEHDRALEITRLLNEKSAELRRDMERALPSRNEQHARLERLIEVAAYARH